MKNDFKALFAELNPVIAADLWKRIGIPKILYGCELWHLNRHAVSELEKVQNITVRIMQGFLPGTSGSASRGLLGLLSVEAETDKRKLPCRKIFLVRLIRWKWNRTSNLTGFLPEIVRILLKYDLMDTLTE